MQLSTSADVFPLIPAMIFKHLCWMWIQKRLDLYGGGQAKKWRPKWTEMDWKKKKVKRTRHTECRTPNVDLFEGECTWHLNRHRNWIETWTLDPKLVLQTQTHTQTHTPTMPSLSFCSSILACQYYRSATGNQQVQPSNKDAEAASPPFLQQEDTAKTVFALACYIQIQTF